MTFPTISPPPPLTARSESRKETAELMRETRHLSRGVQELDESSLKLREEVGALSRVVETANVEPGVSRLTRSLIREV